MKLKRIRKNATYAAGYGCSFRRFKKLVRSSPDSNISRIPARRLKSLWLEVKDGFKRGGVYGWLNALD